MNCMLFAALLYPSVVKTGANLFADGLWETRVDIPKAAEACRWDKTRGGPFSADETVWTASSPEPQSCFWRQRVPLRKGRRYLMGAWVRRDKARVLLWCYGRTRSDKPYDRRAYLLGGFNSCLDIYLRPEIKSILGGGGDAWHLLYRPIEVTEDLAGAADFKFGVFMSTGTVEFSHPFLVDVTGMDRIPLVAEVKGDKGVSRLAVELVGLRDLQWEKRFPVPAAGCCETIDAVDALRGFGNSKRVDGNMLSVRYADGSSENVYAPQEGASLTH